MIEQETLFFILGMLVGLSSAMIAVAVDGSKK
jgi:hypothetical protein